MGTQTPMPFRRVPTGDPVLQQIQDAIVAAFAASAADLPATGPSGKVGFSGPSAEVPIGVPVPWFKHLFPSTYALPNNWVLCDGRTIVDEESPLNGQVIPDLNGGGRFVRAATPANSGTLQAADAIVPAHLHAVGTLAISPDPHSHNQQHFTTGITGTTPGSATANATAANFNIGTGSQSLSITGSTASDGGSGAETRPINIGLPMICRIK